MSKNYKKSAKDIAFDKERTDFRRKIREQASKIDELNRKISDISQEIAKKDDEIRQKEEWIARLLEYMDLTDEELKKFIESEKKKTEIIEHLHSMKSVFGRIGSLYGL